MQTAIVINYNHKQTIMSFRHLRLSSAAKT